MTITLHSKIVNQIDFRLVSITVKLSCYFENQQDFRLVLKHKIRLFLATVEFFISQVTLKKKVKLLATELYPEIFLLINYKITLTFTDIVFRYYLKTGFFRLVAIVSRFLLKRRKRLYRRAIIYIGETFQY